MYCLAVSDASMCGVQPGGGRASAVEQWICQMCRKFSHPHLSTVLIHEHCAKLEGTQRVRTHALLLLTLTLTTLTFDLSIQNHTTCIRCPPCTKFEHFGIIRF